MADTFSGYTPSISDPAQGAEAVTPGTPFTNTCKAIYVGGAGNINLTTAYGDTVTFSSAAAGEIIPIRATVVNSSSTTATNMIALYD